MPDITSLIREELPVTCEKNVYHFIGNDEERPKWSKTLDNYIAKNPKHLQIKRMYQFYRSNIENDIHMQSYFQYISELGGVIVDLASGPSGYFAPVFDFMKENSSFIATDACKAIIKGHQKANKDKRFYLFDVDLDKGLPFQDKCIDAFCGNLLNNVDNYKELLTEVGRCLKPGGRFAVIELFYDKDTQTYDYLREKDAVFFSLENFISVCQENGLQYLDGIVRKEIIGKISEGDLLPIGENDRCMEMILYFEKM